MKYHLNDKPAILKIYKKPAPTAHKRTQGHAFLIGGSWSKMGSMVLSSKAAIKSGCGLLTTFIPRCGYEILQIAVPEAMVLTCNGRKRIGRMKISFQPDAIGIERGIFAPLHFD